MVIKILEKEHLKPDTINLNNNNNNTTTTTTNPNSKSSLLTKEENLLPGITPTLKEEGEKKLDDFSQKLP